MKVERIGWTTAVQSYDYGYMVEELEILQDFDIYNSGKKQNWRKVKISGDTIQVENQINRYFSGFGGFQEEDPRDLKNDYMARDKAFKEKAKNEEDEFNEVISSQDLKVLENFYKNIKFSNSKYEPKIKEAIEELKEKIRNEELDIAISKLPSPPETAVFYKMVYNKYKRGNYKRTDLNDLEEELNESYDLEVIEIGTLRESKGSYMKGGIEVKNTDRKSYLSLEDREDNHNLENPYSFYCEYSGPVINENIILEVNKMDNLKNLYYLIVDDEFYWVIARLTDHDLNYLIVYDYHGEKLKKNSKIFKKIKEVVRQEIYTFYKDKNEDNLIPLLNTIKKNTQEVIKPWLEKFWIDKRK